MNEYQVWTTEASDPVKVHAETVEVEDGRLWFSATGQGVVECFQPFAWSHFRLSEADVMGRPTECGGNTAETMAWQSAT